MTWKGSLGCLLALAIGASAGCRTADPSSPSASPTVRDPVMTPTTTNAPSIDNADAAGAASVPGTHTSDAPVVVTPPPAASPVIVVPPAR